MNEKNLFDIAEGLVDKVTDMIGIDEEKIVAAINKVKDDEDLKAQLKENPVKAVEDLLGVDLPDEQVKFIAKRIADKVTKDGIDDLLADTKGIIKGLLK